VKRLVTEGVPSEPPPIQDGVPVQAARPVLLTASATRKTSRA
jgi:hypothetical protein